MGWELLMNENRILTKGEDSIALIGVENYGARGRFARYGKLDVAYAGVEELPVKILLSHDPSHWDSEVRTKYKDIDLTLSGHTHGAQFGIETAGFKWSPIKYMYKQWAGIYKEQNQFLYVNRGFGYLGYPGRLGIRPEVGILTLV
jgi:predicted MPP superfamily phosphohydrolase